MPVNIVPWDDMTPGQKEYTIYIYAGAYMREVLHWPEMPRDMAQRLDELDELDVWAVHKED